MSRSTDTDLLRPWDRADLSAPAEDPVAWSNPIILNGDPYADQSPLRLDALTSSCPSTAGPRCEIVQRVKNFPGLPHPIAGEAGELIEDARVHQRCDGA